MGGREQDEAMGMFQLSHARGRTRLREPCRLYKLSAVGWPLCQQLVRSLRRLSEWSVFQQFACPVGNAVFSTRASAARPPQARSDDPCRAEAPPGLARYDNRPFTVFSCCLKKKKK